MKKLILVIASVCFAHFSYSQTVPLDSVANYVGKTVTVCSKVESTYESKGEKKVTRLNFGNPYPNTTFVAVIFEADLGKFKYVPSEFLKGKKVCITGRVELFKEKPEIVVSSEAQIKIEE